MNPAPLKKTILFLDDEGRQATLFDPFAATLRRRGIRTVRVTLSRPGPVRAIRDALFYSEVLSLDGADAKDRIRALFARSEVADVQLGEATIARIGLSCNLVATLAEGALACAACAPSALFDKYEVNERLGGAGVLVPPQMQASTCDADAAAERLGLPLVVKRRVAEGGRGVAVTETAAAAEKALSAWQAPRAEVFFQKFVPGELVMYGAVAGGSGPLVERCFRATELQRRWGPTARAVMYEDPDVVRTGREVIRLLGVRGLVQFDFIRDADGGLWHLDANPRCWGSMLAADAQGAGFIAAYEDLVRQRATRKATPKTAETEFSIQPHGLLSAASAMSSGTLRAEWREFARFCRAGPGIAYGAVIALKAVGMAAGVGARRP